MKFIRIKKYDNSRCCGQFVFFSPKFDELAVKWYFPYGDFDLKQFLKMYPELTSDDVEVVSPSQSDFVLVCNYPEVDAVLTDDISSIDFNAERFFRKWNGEMNEIEWQTPDCEVWCGLSWVGHCPHPAGCPYKQPYFHTDFAVVVAPEAVADIWLVPNSELKLWR